MRIAHVIQRYPPAVGGSELWAREVSLHLTGRGHAVEVHTMNIDLEDEYWAFPLPERREVSFGPLWRDEGIVVRRYNRTLLNPLKIKRSTNVVLQREIFDGLFNFFFSGPHSLEMYLSLPEALGRADIVHLHALPYPHNFIGYLVARFKGKAVVCTPHFHAGDGSFEKRSSYSLLARCDAVIAVSEWEKEYLSARGVPAGRIHVTGNGIHLDEYRRPGGDDFARFLSERHGVGPEDPVVAVVSRKVLQKGIDFLLDAARLLIRRRENLHVLIAGPGSHWFDTVYATLSPDERRRIVDLGFLSHEEKVGLLGRADLLVLPSRNEAFGIVFLEAWACGAPVMGCDSGALPTIIGDGGLTFPYGDAEALSAGVLSLLEDPRTRRLMARRGLGRVRSEFTWERIGAMVEEVYRKVFAGRDGK